MFSIFTKKKKPEPKKQVSAFSTHMSFGASKEPITVKLESPIVNGVAFDSWIGETDSTIISMPDAQQGWYLAHNFIGYPMCAYISKQWIVGKACSMPARDVIRQGYEVDCGCTDVIDDLTDTDEKYEIENKCRDYVRRARVFGGCAALFLVSSTDPDFYEMPFNIDGVVEGMYRGIVLIDPVNMRPDLTMGNVQDPASPDYMKPTYWIIGNRRYHHSHLMLYTPYPVEDILKPTYNYFGVSVPERIYERVYAAERLANEAPQLAMTKRTPAMGISNLFDIDRETLEENIKGWSETRDNYAVFIHDALDTFTQSDTALGDLDPLIMTGYQLVAAGAEVPATKLIETTPKGFNSTGEYEESSYRESLESIASNALIPLLQKHYKLVAKSMNHDHEDIQITFKPLDTPTAAEQAQINLAKAQTMQMLQATQAVDPEDIRNALIKDKTSDFFGLESYEDYEEAQEVGESEREAEANWQTTELFSVDPEKVP